MIPSTFRNIDALVQDKSLASVNGDHQHGSHEGQNQTTSSSFHPFSQEDDHHSLHSPSRDVHHQLPAPLNPVETRITR